MMDQLDRTGRPIRHPGVFVVGWFVGLIAIGTILLSLPISHRSDVGFSDALFTSASAVTVTGLAVVDTGTGWSSFGEVVLLGLIQIGGLGILTIAGFFGIALNRRLGVRSGMLAGTEIGLTELGVVRTLIRQIVVFVVITEATVTVLLTVWFWLVEGQRPLTSLHLGLFHAVSAFNNAGFSIVDGGLEGYADDTFVSLVVMATFVVGGLGFPVVFELRRRWREPGAWSLHSRTTLAVSGLLLVGGAVVVGALEWSNPETLGRLAWHDRIVAALFQSATARTAGFNTVPIGSLQNGSLLALILLMVIGAGSASTGGGIKVSTAAVVFRSAMGELRGDRATNLFDRRVSTEIQRQALTLMVMATATVGTAAFVLAVLHPDLPLGEVLFEAASAFGTVGVSTGVTTELTEAGRLVVILIMYLGRVGPITFGTAVLIRRERRRYQFATEDLIVG